jgi:hypothetical protein
MLLRITVRMTLQTQPMGESQEVIGIAAMNEMACQTSVTACRRAHVVVVDERSLLVAMAVEAEFVVLRLELTRKHPGHGIVAIVAAQLTFLDRMMRAHIELSPLAGMARKAEFELTFIHQELRVAGVTAMA